MATIEGVEIDLMPTDGMKEEAQRYRDWKAEAKRAALRWQPAGPRRF